MEAIGAVLFTNIGTQLLKKYIYPKYGATGVQVCLFIVSLFIAGVLLAKDNSMEVKRLFEIGSALFMTAMATYEIIWKKFTMFK